MKFNCGPTWEAKMHDKERWHRWFAWRPVRVGAFECVWLETIWRKGKFWSNWGDCGWDWEYKVEP